MLQILQIYHAGSRVDGPSQVTVASSFLIILLQKSSSPLQVPISNPLLSCFVPSQISTYDLCVVDPSRGLLRDCEIFGNIRITFVSSTTGNYNFARTNQETGRRGKVCIITKRLTYGKLLLCVSPI